MYSVVTAVVFVVYPTYNEKGRDRVDDALGTFSTFLVFMYAIYRFAISITMFETYRAVYIPDTILLFVLPFFFMLHMTYVKVFLFFRIQPVGLAWMTMPFSSELRWALKYSSAS